MLASDSSSVLRTKPPIPARTQIRSRFTAGVYACFAPGSRSRPNFAPGHKLSLNLIKMEVLRQMGRGWFKSHRDKGLKVETDSGGQDFFDVSANAAKPVPQHLVIMVNGINGSPADWRWAAEQFVKRLPEKVIIHRSECNSSRLTFDGVDTMGERLAEEVLSVVRRWPGVQKISFVAHSLGGLIARYAIERLLDNSSTLEHCFSEEQTKDSAHYVKQYHEAKIAGLEPMNFITVATPHLGSRGNKQLPLLCGLPFLERRASQTAHLVAGRSGKHLFLMDNNDGKPPLLLRMADDTNDLKFISALRVFKRRVAYANANYDRILYSEEMIRGLTQVPWERVDVSFQKSRQRYIAHITIQVKTYWLNSDGADVVFHMMDNFLL
ncbi:hypothetical protein L6164_014093 [Bauhinia variegata]|uniref:Uncharacterized protein n=1 Tax=Bauhinia variegata TaxID=167791 RepID=A0ACB9NI82_BAUVA|nr:hypothetical protein L6164_014093 [Bauhinia variegata]